MLARVALGAPLDGVTLQVNVAPSDLPFASVTLRHHLRQWRRQVVRVIYTLDLRKSAGPRGDGFEERRPGMIRLLDDLARHEDGACVSEVDYSEPAVRRVASMFFGGAAPPTKDCFGAPFYAYFFGLAMVPTRYVLHMDCDILFGGGSSTWLSEALELIASRPDVLFVCPLAGPPTADAHIPRRVLRAQQRTQALGSKPLLERQAPRTYRLRHVSSRVFLADLVHLQEIGPLTTLDAPPWIYGADPNAIPVLPAETVLSEAMRDQNRARLDFLGTGDGMWFLHPGQRGEAFAANLPNLIAAIESGEIPASQRGSYELADEWLSAVGPMRFERPKPRLRDAAKWLARATGVLGLRERVRRIRWRHGRP